MKLRLLRIGEARYRWRTSRRKGADGYGGADLFTAYREGCARAPLRVFFVADAARGPEYVARRGLVVEYSGAKRGWNLNLPSVARALIAAASGWDCAAGRPHEVADGWSLLAAALPDGSC